MNQRVKCKLCGLGLTSQAFLNRHYNTTHKDEVHKYKMKEKRE